MMTPSIESIKQGQRQDYVAELKQIAGRLRCQRTALKNCQDPAGKQVLARTLVPLKLRRIHILDQLDARSEETYLRLLASTDEDPLAEDLIDGESEPDENEYETVREQRILNFVVVLMLGVIVLAGGLAILDILIRRGM